MMSPKCPIIENDGELMLMVLNVDRYFLETFLYPKKLDFSKVLTFLEETAEHGNKDSKSLVLKKFCSSSSKLVK